MTGTTDALMIIKKDDVYAQITSDYFSEKNENTKQEWIWRLLSGILLYAKMYDFLMRFEKDIRIRKSSYMAEETKNLLNIIQIESIWGKKKTMDLFYNLLEELYKSPFKYIKDFEKAHNKNNKKILQFQNDIRKELGLKD